jgi:hypothetical protein
LVAVDGLINAGEISMFYLKINAADHDSPVNQLNTLNSISSANASEIIFVDVDEKVMI